MVVDRLGGADNDGDGIDVVSYASAISLGKMSLVIPGHSVCCKLNGHCGLSWVGPVLIFPSLVGEPKTEALRVTYTVVRVP